MRTTAVATALLLVLAACSRDSSGTATPSATPLTPTTETTSTIAAPTATGAPPQASATHEAGDPDPIDPIEPIELVRQLAADELAGRDNLTEGSALARRLILNALRSLAQPPIEGQPGDDAYLQPYEDGTNVLAVIPGAGALADEYVIVGAHYDHFAPGDCDLVTAEDDICNGAADNAAGVTQVIAITAALRGATTADPDRARRSVLLAFWDGEEDGFTGSRFYVEHPTVPLEQTIAYVNFDIQGSSFAPALASATFLVGAETGGPPLEAMVERVVAASDLDYYVLSQVFGQGRSDHRTFAAAEIPILFLTDAPNGCYHTVHDDFAHLDTAKLLDQIDASAQLVSALTIEAPRPRFAKSLPAATFSDAQQFLRLLTRAVESPVFEGDARTALAAATDQVQAIVDAGPAAFDDTAVVTLLAIAAAATDQLADLDCP